MDSFRAYICEKDADFARSMVFLLNTRRTADPGLRTANAYAAMLRIVTYGTLLCFEDRQGELIGIVGYTMGSPQQEYEDREVAYVEYCLTPVSRHGTLFFLRGLRVLVSTIRERQPEAVFLSLAAEEHNHRNNRLYNKFVKRSGIDENPGMNLNLYMAPLESVIKYVQRFD